jgi:hypothetical protein
MKKEVDKMSAENRELKEKVRICSSDNLFIVERYECSASL